MSPSPQTFESSPHWPYLAASAVLTTFAADQLNPIGTGTRDLNRVAAMVIDHAEPIRAGPAAGRWKLRDDVRRRVLATLGSRGRIRLALEANRPEDDPTARALWELVTTTTPPTFAGRALQDLLGIDRAVEWLQSARVRPLPARSEIQSWIQREKLIEPLKRLIVGFEGRQDELRRLRAFVDTQPSQSALESVSRFSLRVLNYVFRANPPLFIHGPGGSGKSTLVARFITEHAGADGSQPMPFVLLDFDRSTLDAARPDGLIADVVNQLTIQFPAHNEKLVELQELVEARLLGEDRVQLARSVHYADAVEIRQRLAAVMNDIISDTNQNLLFVVDTFEVVQRRGTTAVFTILELVATVVSMVRRLRVVLVGRSALRKENFTSFAEEDELPPWRDFPLGGFDPTAGRAYLKGRLRANNVTAPSDADLERVVRQVRGNPLGLRLAANVIAREGVKGVEDAVGQVLLNEAIAEEQLQGILHERIVSLLDDEVQKIANPGLIVRRITSGVIENVLAEPCGIDLQKTPADSLLLTLRQEGTLFETVDDKTLRHRPDVRRIMLPALRRDLGTTAKRIDEAAVTFWQKGTSPEERAEEIYHRLWSGDPRWVLSSRWMPEAAGLLEDALDEFLTVAPNEWARIIWLSERLERELPDKIRKGTDQYEWERDIEKKVRTLMASGDAAGALRILNERSPDSRLPGSALWTLEIDAHLLLGHVQDAERAIDTALSRLTETSDAGRTLELLSRQVDVCERIGRLDRAQSAATKALALARTSRDTVAVFACGVTLLRLERKLRAPVSPEMTALRQELLALAETSAIKRAFEEGPSLLREAAAELGSDAPSLLADALERLGIQSEDTPSFPQPFRDFMLTFDLTVPKGEGQPVFNRSITRNMARRIRDGEVKRPVLENIASLYARSVERIINQTLTP